MNAISDQSHITVDQEAGAFSLIVLTKKNKKMYFFLFKYLSSALTKLISRARGICPQVCAFPVLSVSVTFKLVLHWLWQAGFGGGKDVKTTTSSPDFRLKGHPVAAPCQAEAREASFLRSSTLDIIPKSLPQTLKASDEVCLGLTSADFYANPLIWFNHIGSC